MSITQELLNAFRAALPWTLRNSLNTMELSVEVFPPSLVDGKLMVSWALVDSGGNAVCAPLPQFEVFPDFSSIVLKTVREHEGHARRKRIRQLRTELAKLEAEEVGE